MLIELPSNSLGLIRKVPGTLSEAAGKSMIITSPESIAASSAIRVQGKDLLFLGEVVHSTPAENGQWSVHMSVKRKFMIF